MHENMQVQPRSFGQHSHVISRTLWYGWLVPKGLVIWESADLLGFSHNSLHRMVKSKHPSSESVLGVRRWQEGDHDSDNYSFQLWWAEEPLGTHNMAETKADKIQQQKTSSGGNPVSQEQQSETTVGTRSPKLDSWKLDKDQVTVFQFLTFR